VSVLLHQLVAKNIIAATDGWSLKRCRLLKLLATTLLNDHLFMSLKVFSAEDVFSNQP
jgi:hypothetical protein